MNLTTTCKTKLVATAATGLLMLGLGAGAALAQTSTTDVAAATATITDLQAGDTVSAWRIADADIDSTNNLTYTMASGLPEAYDTVDELASLDAIGAKKAADAIAVSLVETSATTSATAGDDGRATLTLDSGYYLVTVTSTSGSTVVYQNMLVNATPAVADNSNDPAGAYVPRTIDAIAVKKADVTAPTKQVVSKGDDGTAADSTDTHSVGDTATFQINGAIPSYPANATHATYSVTDTPAAGLEVNVDSFNVTVGESALTADDDYTVTNDGDSYTVTFKKPISLSGQSYTITYTAKVASVDPASGEVANKAHATFNPNPYIDSTVNTLDNPATVKTYGFAFQKTAGDDSTPLPGAEFQVKGADGNTVRDAQGDVVTLTSGADGYVSLGGLAAGTYTLIETKVPTGYQKVADFEVTLNADTATGDNPATAGVTETNYLAKTDKVIDPKQGVLPTTGGEGTVALTAGGVVVMAGAAGFIVMARRRTNDR